MRELDQLSTVYGYDPESAFGELAGARFGFGDISRDKEVKEFFHLLLDWQTALQLQAKPMLEYLGLSEAVTENDWLNLCTGQMVPPPSLVNYLAHAYVESHTGLPETEADFRYSAKRARRNATMGYENELGFIPQVLPDLPEFFEYREVLPLPVGAPTGEVKSEDHSFRGELLATLRKRVAELGASFEDSLDESEPGDALTRSLQHMGEKLALHPWQLLGLAPLPQTVTPEMAADALADYYFPNHRDGPHIFDLACHAYEQCKVTDIPAALETGISLNYGTLLQGFMQRKNIDSPALAEQLKTAGFSVSHITINGWQRGSTIPRAASTAAAVAEILHLDAQELEIYTKVYLDTLRTKFQVPRMGRALVQQQIGPTRDLVADGTCEKLAQAFETMLSRRDGETGRSLFGPENHCLRESQQETLDKYTRHLHEHHTTGYAVLPGGCGKTRIAAASCKAAHMAGLKSLVIVPSIAAAENMEKEFHEECPEMKVGRVDMRNRNFSGSVTIMTNQSLLRHFYQSLICQSNGQPYPFNIRDYRFLVADEAHATLTASLRDVLNSMDAVKMALTATDQYYEGKEVSAQFPGLFNYVTPEQAADRGEILRPTTRVIQARINLDMDSLEGLDSKDIGRNAEAVKRLNIPGWNKIFSDVWRGDTDPITGQRIFGNKTFVHCANIEHAGDMARMFNSELMPLVAGNEGFRRLLQDKNIDPDKVVRVAANIDSTMTLPERRALLQQYHNREVLVLTSAKLLTESVNDPQTNTIMNAAPTFSVVNALQRGYRGSRTAPGKESWLIYEALPANWQLSSYAPVLFEAAIRQGKAIARKNRAYAPVDDTPKVKENTLTPAAQAAPAAGEPPAPRSYDLRWELTDIDSIITELQNIREGLQHRPFSEIFDAYMASGGEKSSYDFLERCCDPAYGGVRSKRAFARLLGVFSTTLAPSAIDKDTKRTPTKFMDARCLSLGFQDDPSVMTRRALEFWHLNSGDKTAPSPFEATEQAQAQLEAGEDRAAVASNLIRNFWKWSGFTEAKLAECTQSVNGIFYKAAMGNPCDFQAYIYPESVERFCTIFAPEDTRLQQAIRDSLFGFLVQDDPKHLLEKAKAGEIPAGSIVRHHRLRLFKKLSTYSEHLAQAQDLHMMGTEIGYTENGKPLKQRPDSKKLGLALGYENEDLRDFMGLISGLKVSMNDVNPPPPRTRITETDFADGAALFEEVKAGRIASRAKFFEALREEVFKLGKTDMAARAGVNRSSWLRWENEDEFRAINQEETIAKLCASCGFEAGSADETNFRFFLHSGKPIEKRHSWMAQKLEDIRNHGTTMAAVMEEFYEEFHYPVARIAQDMNLSHSAFVQIARSEGVAEDFVPRFLDYFAIGGQDGNFAAQLLLQPEHPGIPPVATTATEENPQSETRQRWVQKNLPAIRSGELDFPAFLKQYCAEFDTTFKRIANEIGRSDKTAATWNKSGRMSAKDAGEFANYAGLTDTNQDRADLIMFCMGKSFLPPPLPLAQNLPFAERTATDRGAPNSL